MNSTAAPAGPLQLYQRDIQAGIISEDAAQLQAIAALEQRYHSLCAAWQLPLKPWHRLYSGLASRARRSSRAWALPLGCVGRGKTYLMDMFFHALPSERKLRMHFTGSCR